MPKILSKLIPKRIKKKIIKERKIYIYNAIKPYEIKICEKKRFVGKNAVVTGGSGAIGRAICFKLAAEGANVFVAGRTEKTVMDVVNEIRDMGLNAKPFILDVQNQEKIEYMFDKYFNQNNLDILINCAGGGSRDKMNPLANQSIEVIDNILNTNLRGTMLCTRKAAQYMIPKKYGKIVIISSSIGVGGKANYSEYAASKSGLIGFMKSMALELGEYGINVNCVSPGFIQRGEYDDNQMNYLKKTNCLHTIGTLEDVANAVSFMVSDDATFITGQNLGVDGGRTLGLYGD